MSYLLQWQIHVYSLSKVEYSLFVIPEQCLMGARATFAIVSYSVLVKCCQTDPDQEQYQTTVQCGFIKNTKGKCECPFSCGHESRLPTAVPHAT
jgi:hypothetical protein